MIRLNGFVIAAYHRPHRAPACRDFDDESGSLCTILCYPLAVISVGTVPCIGWRMRFEDTVNLVFAGFWTFGGWCDAFHWPHVHLTITCTLVYSSFIFSSPVSGSSVVPFTPSSFLSFANPPPSVKCDLPHTSRSRLVVYLFHVFNSTCIMAPVAFSLKQVI